MDKKMIPSRPRVQQIRPKANLPSGNFIALGGGGARPSAPDTGALSTTQPAVPSSIKREPGQVPPSLLAPAAKKPRLVGPEIRQSAPPSSSVIVSAAKRETPIENIWQVAAGDVSPSNFSQRLEVAETKGRIDKIERLVLGLAKFLYEHRTKAPDPSLTAQFCFLAREKPHYFRDMVVEALCAVLRKPVGLKIVSRCHPLAYQLVCSVLYRALQNREEWPDVLVKVYLDDALTDRAWVDRRDCQQLVQSIITAFGTEQPSPEFIADLYFGEGSRSSTERGGSGSPVHAGSSPLYDDDSRSRDTPEAASLLSKLEDEGHMTGSGSASTGGLLTPVTSPARFMRTYDAIHNYTIDVLRDWWSRRLDTVPKGLVKTMAVCCGYQEVRLAAAQKLDAWLQNAKLQRPATELMTAVFINFKEHSDMEVLSYLTRLRFKSRVTTNNFCYALKELFAKVSTSLSIVLKLVVHNELAPTARAQNNMLIIGQCFQFNSEASSQTLADICLELLFSTKEDYSRLLRSFLREVVRSALKFDFALNTFSRALMQERPVIATFDPALKDRVFHALEDLVSLSAFIGIGPNLRDIALAVGRGDKREIAVLSAYQRSIRQLQNDAVAWCHTVVPALFRPSKDDYARCLYRVTFLERPDFYSSKDGWPTDQERNLYLKIIAESGLDEDLMLRVLTIGLSSDNALSPANALELVEQLVNRTAAAICDPKFSVSDPNSLKITNLNIIDLIFNCCRYRPPDSYPLPASYTLPMLAITKSFWLSANLLLMLAAYNPVLIGRIIWENYPTLQFLMEMVISEDYTFPPATAVTETCDADQIKQQDLQMAEAEKHEILELEGYLAPHAITESNSSLLAHLMRLEPKGVPRRPPQPMIDVLKSLNQKINLGLSFCRSRDPDFLLEIIDRQGSSHSLPWLIQLIQKNEGSLRLLPVQCLCEFLLHHLEAERCPPDEGTEATIPSGPGLSSHLKHSSKELRQRLIDVVWEPTTELNQVESTLLYFFNRLQADTAHDRQMAVHALDILLKRAEDAQAESSQDDKTPSSSIFFWLLDGFTSIPHFPHMRGSVINILSKCIMIETDLERVRAYIAFMHKYAVDDELDDLALNLGKMVYGRRRLIERLLPRSGSSQDSSDTLRHLLDIFCRHLSVVQAAASGLISWSANQDQLLIQWGEATSAIMNVNVVSAMLLLLGYPKPEGASDSYDKILDSWFNNDFKPTAYMLDTTEEAELIPEDVKFQLVCSNNDVSVDAVLKTMDSRQLLTCIEYSGLPVETLNKVCLLLDSVVLSDSALLNEMRPRAETWLSCLLSHSARGANIGEKFCDWCRRTTDELKNQEAENMDTSSRPSAPILQPSSLAAVVTDSGPVHPLLSKAFYATPPATEKRELVEKWSQLLSQIISNPTIQASVVKWLDTQLRTKAVHLIDGFNGNSDMAISLLRLLELMGNDSVREYQTFRRHLLKEEKRLHESILAVFKKRSSTEAAAEKMDFEPSPAEASVSADLDETELSDNVLKILERLGDGSVDCEEADVDRLLLLDPEIVRVTPWKQLEYLFGTNSSVGLRHMLSLLPHWGHVDTLRRVVEKLLSWPGKTYDCKKVLDFIAAVNELPRLWAGREPKLPRHYQRENILNLTQAQLENLLHYIVSELVTIQVSLPPCDMPPTSDALTKSKMEWRPHEPFSSGNGVAATSMEGRLQERLRLLLECCQGKFQGVVRWFFAAAAGGYDRNVIQLLILELYFAKPEISRFVPDLSILRDVRCLIDSGHTNLDATLFRLLNAASRYAENKADEKDLEQVNTKLNEIAASHPTAVVRHVPLIAAYLRGTTSMSIRKYERTNYLEWFDMMLQLLDMLRPTIYDVHYVDAILDIMKSFFEFIQNHGLRGNKYVRTVEKVVKFLCAFHDKEQALVSQFIQLHSSLIQAITAHYSESSVIRELKKISC